MAERQRQVISPPLDNDRESLANFSSVLQSNLEQIFQLAHKHSVRTVAPATNEGNIGDIFLVAEAGTFKIYAKFPSGWKSATLT